MADVNVQAHAGCTLELRTVSPVCIHTERFCSRCRAPCTHSHLPGGSSQSDGTSWGEGMGGRSKLHMETVTLAALLKLKAQSVCLTIPDGCCSQNQGGCSKVLNPGWRNCWFIPEPEMAGHGLGFVVAVAASFSGHRVLLCSPVFYCCEETP